jgi:hypothetical protein
MNVLFLNVSLLLRKFILKNEMLADLQSALHCYSYALNCTSILYFCVQLLYFDDHIQSF